VGGRIGTGTVRGVAGRIVSPVNGQQVLVSAAVSIISRQRVGKARVSGGRMAGITRRIQTASTFLARPPRAATARGWSARGAGRGGSGGKPGTRATDSPAGRTRVPPGARDGRPRAVGRAGHSSVELNRAMLRRIAPVQPGKGQSPS